MEQSNLDESDKMLNVYIYDYLIKRGFPASGRSFAEEALVVDHDNADKIEKPGGFLSEWWSATYSNGARINRNNRNFEVLNAKIRSQPPLMQGQLLPPNRSTVDWEAIRHSVFGPTGGGIKLKEAAFVPTGNILTCCNYSSDGKFLAIGGNDKKVLLLDTVTYNTRAVIQQGPRHTITDICFRPESHQCITASSDGSVRHFDAENIFTHLGTYNSTDNTSCLSSLDINPALNNLFSFSDNKDKIHYCTLNPFLEVGNSELKGVGQLRFQPSGKLLAAASNDGTSVLDFVHDKEIHFFEGIVGSLPNVCWHPNGDLLATVTDEAIKVWSLSSEKCIRELKSYGNHAHSCIFDPKDPCVLVTGRSPANLEFWHILQNKSTTFPAHIDKISSLSRSPATGMIASMSFDGMVKMWETVYEN